MAPDCALLVVGKGAAHCLEPPGQPPGAPFFAVASGVAQIKPCGSQQPLLADSTLQKKIGQNSPAARVCSRCSCVQMLQAFPIKWMHSTLF